ncbi:MAG: hypothetical protein M0R03_21410 [Novosphingobium sp.]|jgi:hypothetical protein|nr:hypothetical protein [Novosphingobium sp.]
MKVYYWRTQLKYHWGWEVKKEGVSESPGISIGDVYIEHYEGIYRSLDKVNIYLKEKLSEEYYPDAIDIQFEYKEVDLDWDKI